MNIHVGNLSPGTSLSELLGCFAQFGIVVEGSISVYRVDGRMRALGTVVMPSRERGQAAIVGLQNKELSGNVMKLREE